MTATPHMHRVQPARSACRRTRYETSFTSNLISYSSKQVLDSLAQSLDHFDRAVERGAEGRRVHIGAAANLEAVSDEVIQIVKVLDGLNRFRFLSEPDRLAAWTSARNIVGPPSGGRSVGRARGESEGRTGGQSEPPVQESQIKPAA